MKLLVNRHNRKMKSIGSCKAGLNLSKQNFRERLTKEGIYRTAYLSIWRICHRTNRNFRQELTIFMEFRLFKWSRTEVGMTIRTMNTAKIRKNNNSSRNNSKSMTPFRSSTHEQTLSSLSRHLSLRALPMEEDTLISSFIQSCWWGLRTLQAWYRGQTML